MRATTAAILVVLAVLAGGAVWFLGAVPNGSGGQTAIASGSSIFPDLAPKLPTATRVEISHQGQTLTIETENGQWGIAGKGGYPVQADKLREFFAGLVELRLTEPRTSDPTEYGRLGVDDPSATAGSSLVTVIDGSGATLAKLIVGHRRVRTQGDVPETVYVRRPGEAQAWLAEGNLPVDADPQLWIARDIANVPGARIASVTVSRGSETLVFAREGDKLVLKSPAEHPKLDDYKVEDVARAYENLTLTDVKPAAEQPGEKIGSSIFTTTDGEAITATVFKAGTADKAEIWATFAAKGDGGSKAAADALQAKLTGWTYQLGSWKEQALVPDLAELKAEEPTPAAPPAGAPPVTNTPGTAAPTPILPPSATPPAGPSMVPSPAVAPQAPPAQAAPVQPPDAPAAPDAPASPGAPAAPAPAPAK